MSFWEEAESLKKQIDIAKEKGQFGKIASLYTRLADLHLRECEMYPDISDYDYHHEMFQKFMQDADAYKTLAKLKKSESMIKKL